MEKLRLLSLTKVAAAAAALILVAAGCATGPKALPDRSFDSPPVKYCHDGVGHISGYAPWILGGQCCCTPTRARFESYAGDGTVPADMTYESFRSLFTERGIVTDLDTEYRGSNCRGDHGLHVVFGGDCMVTPTPGTLTYEEVTSGIRKRSTGEEEE